MDKLTLYLAALVLVLFQTTVVPYDRFYPLFLPLLNPDPIILQHAHPDSGVALLLPDSVNC